MTEPLPTAVPRTKKVKVMITKPSKAEYDAHYVSQKLTHMRAHLGIEAEFGPHGGACPKWLKDQMLEEKKAGKRR